MDCTKITKSKITLIVMSMSPRPFGLHSLTTQATKGILFIDFLFDSGVIFLMSPSSTKPENYAILIN